MSLRFPPPNDQLSRANAPGRLELLSPKINLMPAERNTKQRKAIKDAIEAAGVPLSPKEILDSAQRKVSGLGLATVYRTLKLLADENLVEVVEIPGESPRYELAGKGHHHHFYCRDCGKVFEIHDCPGDFARLAPRGFKTDGHELVLFGRCDQCAKR